MVILLATGGNLMRGANLLRLWILTLIIVTAWPLIAYCGNSTLTICNKGSVDIYVVIAMKVNLLVANFIDVSGWQSISPGQCKLVYNEAGDYPAYIGFGFAQGNTAGHIETVPDFGLWPWGTKVLAKSNRRFCVSEETMSYRFDHRDPASDCASFHPDGKKYFAFEFALYFFPIESKCETYGFNGQVSCYGGEYYLNIRPTAHDKELHASLGSSSGADHPADTFGLDIFKNLPEKKGTRGELMKVLENLLQGPESPRSERTTTPFKRFVICVPQAVVAKKSWEDSGERTKEFKRTLKNFLKVHSWFNLQDGVARVRMLEIENLDYLLFQAEEVRGEVKDGCAGDAVFSVKAPKQITAPAPSASPAPHPYNPMDDDRGNLGTWNPDEKGAKPR
jgi:hypothetical protein